MKKEDESESFIKQENDPELKDKSVLSEKEGNSVKKDSCEIYTETIIITESVKTAPDDLLGKTPRGERQSQQPPVSNITPSSVGLTDNEKIKPDQKSIPKGQKHNKTQSKSVKQTINEQTDQRNNKPINNTCPQQIHVNKSSVQAGDTDEANSTQVQHGDEHYLEINSFFSATQFKTPGSNLEGAAVADGMKKEQENMKRADSVSEIVKLKENVSDNDKQEVKQSIRPHVSVIDDSPDESEETNLKQANQHTRKEPIHNVTTEREPTNTVARTANSRPAISLNPKPPATHPTQPQVNLQQPNVLPYPTQQAYVEPTRPVADPTTKGVLSGVKKTHPNRKIYDDLRGIDWVQGYYSEGKSIIVYADMTRLQEDVALKEITFRTGQPEGKFHLKHEAEIA